MIWLKVFWTLRASASSSVRRLDDVGLLLDARDEVRLGGHEVARAARAAPPCTRIRSVPSGHLDHARHRAGHAHPVEVVGPRRLDLGSFEATITSMRSPPSTSLTSLIERSWPIASGVSVSGKATRVLERQHREPLGQRARRSPPPGCRRAWRSRSSRLVPSRPSIGIRRAVVALLRQRDLDPQHAVLVGGARAVGLHLGAELDHAPEGPVRDLDLLVQAALGLLRRGARRR